MRQWKAQKPMKKNKDKIKADAKKAKEKDSETKKLMAQVKAKELPKPKPVMDLHPYGNPHYLLDPRAGMIAVKAIAEKLSAIRPERTEAFNSRAEAYIQKLFEKMREWEVVLASFRGQQVVTYHRSFSDWISWAGFELIGSVEKYAGGTPEPEDVWKLVKEMKEKQVEWLFVTPFANCKLVKRISYETGAKLIELPAQVGDVPEAKTYITLLDSMIDRLKKVGPIDRRLKVLERPFFKKNKPVKYDPNEDKKSPFKRR